MRKQALLILILVVAAVGALPLGHHWVVSGGSVPAGSALNQSQEVPVEAVHITGNRRIPESTVKIWITTREGEPYNPATLDRDIRALYAQGHFEDVRVFAEDGTRGGKIVSFEVREWPLILDIKY